MLLTIYCNAFKVIICEIVQELFSVSWKTFRIIEYFFTSSKQPLTGFKLVFSIVPYVICLPYPLGHGTVKKLSNKKWFCFFFLIFWHVQIPPSC